MKQIFFLLLLLVILISCNQQEITVKKSFPFRLETSYLPKIIKEQDTVQFNLFIKSNEQNNYQLNHFTTAGEGVLLSAGKPLKERANIDVDKIVPLEFLTKGKGNNTINFIVADGNGFSDTLSITIESLEIPSEFNFDVQDVTGKDSIPVGGSVNYSFYIKQLGFYVKNKSYDLIFTVSNQALDGIIEIEENKYRQGDWINLNYDIIKENNNITLGTYQPFFSKKGDYTITFVCKDKRSEKTVTKSKKLRVY